MKGTSLSRRRFLLVAGASLGASALTCSGLAVLGGEMGDSPAGVALPRIMSGEDTMSKILVVYASESGSTAGVAEAIARTLAESGAQVDLRPVQEVGDLSPYRAVVVGSAIHSGAWLPEAMAFVQEHGSELRRMPFAAFLVCMTMAMKPSYREGVGGWLEPVRSVARPVSEGLFAGASDLGRIRSFKDRLMLRAAAAIGVWPTGDHRDWNAIRAWAQELKPLLSV